VIALNRIFVLRVKRNLFFGLQEAANQISLSEVQNLVKRDLQMRKWERRRRNRAEH